MTKCIGNAKKPVSFEVFWAVFHCKGSNTKPHRATFDSSASYYSFLLVDVLNVSHSFLNPQFPVLPIDCAVFKLRRNLDLLGSNSERSSICCLARGTTWGYGKGLSCVIWLRYAYFSIVRTYYCINLFVETRPRRTISGTLCCRPFSWARCHSTANQKFTCASLPL